MYRYIALLRGINVSGQKKILMADLRALFESLGLMNVQTYIQSGNVLFHSEKEIASEYLSEAIENQYGWHVPVLLTTARELQTILDRCPFPKEKKEKSYFGLLYDPPSTVAVETTLSYNFPNEEFHITPHCVYLFCAKGAGNAKTGTAFFERHLKVAITFRNFNTMRKLVALAED
ncbi:DUF1697 domain-containing protein [Pukyongia salina]|uniref:DUF1697 domain-containing protein n=1 Tax=Pukyongia salina TaxID=2094025 RepID=A0A2S0HXV0_9FLAO|nr:DUF1697 domain-containing protein [Pukyongia salina]AVI51003.1 DUF1697 domain-containing protein [Pukyongia salina]